MNKRLNITLPALCLIFSITAKSFGEHTPKEVKKTDEVYFTLSEFPESLAIEKKLSKLKKENKILGDELIQLKQKYETSVIGLETKDGEKVIDIINDILKPKHERWRKVGHEIIEYTRLNEAVTKATKGIISDENYKRRKFYSVFKSEFPSGLYKQVPMYKTMINNSDWRLCNWHHEKETRLKQTIARYKKKMQECKIKALKEILGSSASIEQIEKKQNSDVMQKWFSEKRESFDEYCRWLTLKVSYESDLELIKIRKNR